MTDLCGTCGAYWDCEHKGQRVEAERWPLSNLTRENPEITLSFDTRAIPPDAVIVWRPS